MYKQTIPVDVIAHEARSHQPNGARSKPVPGGVSTVQRAKAEAKYTVALQKQLSAAEDRCLRLGADFSNFKRRAAQEQNRRAAAEKESLVRDLLPVIDNLERAMGSAAASSGQVYEGVQMIWQQLIQVMRQHGFEMREDLGQRFDPKYHDAVSTRADVAHNDHTIVEVWQRGWRRGTDLVRPAKVVVNDLNGCRINGAGSTEQM